MVLSITVGLSLLSLRRRNSAPADDLDVIFAKAQIGLEKKRQRWLLFLIEKEEHRQNLLLQSDEYTIDEESKTSSAVYGNGTVAVSAAEQTPVTALVRDKKRVTEVSVDS